MRFLFLITVSRKRPVIKIPLSSIDKVLVLFSWCLVVSLIIIDVTALIIGPSKVPSHFNFQGEVDSYSGIESLLVLGIIGILVFLGLFGLSHVPHIYNYPFEITEKNALRVYMLSSRMMRTLAIAVLLLFNIISLISLLLATGTKIKLLNIILPASVFLIPGLVIVFLIKIVRLKK